MILTTTWHLYPAEKPREGCYAIKGIDNEGDFHDLFYRIEYASKPSSTWQAIRYWAYETELKAELVQQLQKELDK